MGKLGNSLSSASTSTRKQYNPAQIAKMDAKSATILVAWYDFADNSTVYTDGGSTLATSGASLQQVTNKAYDGLGASSTSLNAVLVQTDGTAKPVWTKVLGWSSGDLGYITLDGVNDVLYSSAARGNVSAGKMGGVTLTQDNFTISFVIKSDVTGTPAADNRAVAGFTDAAGNDTWIADKDRASEFAYHASGARIAGSSTPIGTDFVYWTIVGGVSSTSGSGANSIKIYRKRAQAGSTFTTDSTAQNRVLTANDADVLFALGGIATPVTTPYFDGRIYEYVQYNKALSKGQLDQLNRYYGKKYLIA